jgi:S-adenosylmethionine/arginine decarboxylase-like enzyme
MTLSGCHAAIHTYPEQNACFVDLVTHEDASKAGQPHFAVI